MSLQMWIDILAAYCYSLVGDDFNWVHVTNKLLCSAATGWNFTVSGLLSHGCITAVFRDFRNPDLWDFDSTFPVDVVGYNFM